MARKLLAASLILFFSLDGPVMSAELKGGRGAVPEELADAWERLQSALQEWGEKLRDRLTVRESREGRPLITLMLNNKEQLGLSSEQVRKLEEFRDGFQRQSIRTDADLRIVELDIASLLENDPVDMAKLESKIREAAKLRADLRLARIRAIEQAKAQLNSEQKKKLKELLEERLLSKPPKGEQKPAAKE